LETKANHVLIGAFAVATLLAVAGFFLWLAKSTFEGDSTDYDVVFTESVTGLGKGGKVYFNGIEVGQVTALKIDPERLDTVRARVRLRSDLPLRADAQAKLAYQGLTGIAYILISPGSQNAPVLAPKAGERIAEIPAKTSDLTKLFEGSEDIMTGANDVFVRINRLLGDENLKRVSSTLANLDALSSVLATKREDAGEMITQARLIAEQLNQTLAKLESSSARIEALAATADRVLNEDGIALMKEVREASSSIRTLAENSNQMVVTNQDAVQSFTEHGLVEMGSAVSELRSLLRTLNRISLALENDPAGFVLNKSRPQEYKAK